MEIYYVNLRISFEYGKIRAKKIRRISSHNVKIILFFSWMKLSCYFFRIRNSQDKKPWDKLHGAFTAGYPSSFNNSKVEFRHSSKETFNFLLVFGNGISSNFDSYLKILFKKAKEKQKWWKPKAIPLLHFTFLKFICFFLV